LGTLQFSLTEREGRLLVGSLVFCKREGGEGRESLLSHASQEGPVKGAERKKENGRQRCLLSTQLRYGSLRMAIERAWKGKKVSVSSRVTVGDGSLGKLAL